jgi:acetolactate decarboxylase
MQWFAILCTVPAAPVLSGCTSSHVEVEQVGAMREVMREGHTEPRIRLADAVARPNAYAVGALAGLNGEITIADGDVWVARVAGDGIQVTGPTLVEGDEATLLAVSHVAQWVQVGIGSTLEGAQLEAFIEHAARDRGLDLARPFPFVIEGDATEVDLHVVNGYCPDARDPATIDTEPWRWSLDRSSRILLVGFYAPDAAGVMTHHGTSLHVHAIMQREGGTITGHVDRFAVEPGMTLRVPGGR